jgi:hypothetical protein
MLFLKDFVVANNAMKSASTISYNERIEGRNAVQYAVRASLPLRMNTLVLELLNSLMY